VLRGAPVAAHVDETDPLDEHVVDAAAQLRPDGDACGVDGRGE